MKTLITAAAAALLIVSQAWAHDDHDHAKPVAAVASAGKPSIKLDAHTQEDMERHLAMARAHEQAAQCLASGQSYDACQKQLQTQCKGLALGKNCGMRHAH